MLSKIIQVKQLKAKRQKRKFLNKGEFLLKLILLVSILGAGIFGYQYFTGQEIKLFGRNILSPKSFGLKGRTSSNSIQLPKNLDDRFLWKYVKKKNDRSIAMVTSRNKFNGEDISLGFRCDFDSKGKALFLFGKFFSEEKESGRVTVELNFDDKKIYKSKLNIVLNGKGLAFNDFSQLENIQKYSRLKISIKNSKGKKKTFIFELVGSSNSIDQVLSDCR